MTVEDAREVLDGLDEIDVENLKVGRITRTALKFALKKAGRSFDPSIDFDVILVAEQLNDMLQAGRELFEVEEKVRLKQCGL